MKPPRQECPACGSTDTRKAHIEFEPREVAEVRQCENCPVQYTNTYTHSDVEIDAPQAFTAEQTDGFTSASDLDES